MTTKKSYKFSRVIGRPNYMEFDNGLRINRPDKDADTGKEAVYISGEGWDRWVMCQDYDNFFVALNPYFANPKYPGMNSIFAFCACGSDAVVVGYNQYKVGASASSGGKGFIAGEMLVCRAFTESLIETGKGRHNDGSS